MATRLKVEYDRIGDILYINAVPPYAEQDSEELDGYIIAALTQIRTRSKG